MKIVPINIDRNVSFTDYKKYEDNNELLVYSIFETIQGEGPFAGHPAIFVRLAGCNIGNKDLCEFCDTKFDFDKGCAYTAQQLADKLETFKSPLVVVTGGEPLLQYKVLFNLILLSTKKFQIETNGYFVGKFKNEIFDRSIAICKEIKTSKPVDFFKTFKERISIVISPKTDAAKSYGKFLDWNSSLQGGETKTLDELFFNIPTYLKYVLTSDESSSYNTVPQHHLAKAREQNIPVYVSGMAVYLKSYPEGRISSIWDSEEIDQKATAANYRHCAKYALENQLLVSLQTHLFLGVY